MTDVPVDADPPPGGTGRCPICKRPSDAVLRPFCSKRCADVDLHRWLSGSYAIPVDPDRDEESATDDGDQSET